jgi:Zn-dependent oligopeptidase
VSQKKECVAKEEAKKSIARMHGWSLPFYSKQYREKYKVQSIEEKKNYLNVNKVLMIHYENIFIYIIYILGCTYNIFKICHYFITN